MDLKVRLVYVCEVRNADDREGAIKTAIYNLQENLMDPGIPTSELFDSVGTQQI